jgi:hypothetical protein
VPRPTASEYKRYGRPPQPAEPLHVLALQDEIHDREIEMEEEQERGR